MMSNKNYEAMRAYEERIEVLATQLRSTLEDFADFIHIYTSKGEYLTSNGEHLTADEIGDLADQVNEIETMFDF